MRTTSWTLLSLAAVAALTGCAAQTSYVFAPQHATYWSDGYPAASNPVPPEAPQGSVEIVSFGVGAITPEGSGEIATLHVRMTVSNDGDPTAWAVSTTQQLVEIPGEGRSQPLYVNSDQPNMPAVTIGPREKRVIDFYYPLPAGIDSDDHLTGFDFLWEVTTAARTYASRTHFARLEREPNTVPVRVSYYTGWGPYWWYDPFWPTVRFVHYRPIGIHGHGRVYVRPPVRHVRPTRRDHRRR